MSKFFPKTLARRPLSNHFIYATLISVRSDACYQNLSQKKQKRKQLWKIMVGKPTPLQFQCLSLSPSLLFSKLNHGFFSTSLTTSFPQASTFHFHSPHSKPNIHLQQPSPNTTNHTLTRSHHPHSITHLRLKVHTHTLTLLE